ncbi:hypothetical protein AVEN_106777-1 [Araneus ventricosus]|uniref:Uncharacterized protein n=1 Tax=Araneus ventricosus TaxID=182803 RepID=A0A4Y2F4V0_ARAVE|nr:hypothetical protein AVEN_106777-1 [Araneus ventricosus]
MRINTGELPNTDTSSSVRASAIWKQTALSFVNIEMAASHPGTSNEYNRDTGMQETMREDDTIVLPPNVQQICLLVLSSTEEFIAYTYGGTHVYLNHAKTGENLLTYRDHVLSVCRISFHPTDEVFVTGTIGGSMCVHGIKDQFGVTQSFTYFHSSIRAISFNPKEMGILCACDEAELRIWHYRSDTGVTCFTASVADKVSEDSVTRHLGDRPKIDEEEKLLGSSRFTES